MNNQQIILSLTGPTCSGKNFLLTRLLADTSSNFKFVKAVSTTTRQRRYDEVDRVDYNFLTKAEFDAIPESDFVEFATFKDNLYGMTKAELTSTLMLGHVPVVIFEPSGLSGYRQFCRENNILLVNVFVHTPEQKRLQRLNSRTLHNLGKGLDEAVISNHTFRVMSLLQEERRWLNMNLWDAVVPGDDIEAAVQRTLMAVYWKLRKDEEPKPYTHLV